MSFVAALTTDSGTVDDPTWSDVARAVEMLDGNASTTAILAGSAGEHHLGIGGGKDGRCVVYFTEDNQEFWNVEDASRSAARFLMIVGGQEGDYVETQCVPRAWALQAARIYFEQGTRAGELAWRRQ